MPAARASAWRRSTSQQARNLYVVRGALDGAAARLAAANYTPHLVQRGRLLLDVGRRAVASGNVPSVIEADIDFHLFVYEAVGQSADRRDRPAALAASAPRHGGGAQRRRPAGQRMGRARRHPARARGAARSSEAEALCRGHAEQMADILTGRLKVVISRAA